MNHFENEKGSFEYSIKKSNRKTVSIIVETDSSVRVLAPNKMHQSAIDALLDKKLEWIMVHLEKMSRHQVDALIFVSGECIHYLGAPLNLKIMEVKSKRDQKVIVSGHQLFVYTPNEAPDYVKNLMMIWFRLRSEEVITERVAFYEQQMGTIPAKVVVKRQS